MEIIANDRLLTTKKGKSQLRWRHR